MGKSNGMVGIWDIPAGEPIKHFLHDLMGGPVTAVTFSPDGGLLATAGRDGQLKLRNLRTGKLILRRQHPGPLQASPSIRQPAWWRRLARTGPYGCGRRAGGCSPSAPELAPRPPGPSLFAESGPIPADDEAEAQTRFSAVFTPDGSLQIRTLQTG